jgi:hypothetical protein
MIKDGKPSLISRLARRRFTKTFQARISQAVEARARPMKRPRHGRLSEKAKVRMEGMLFVLPFAFYLFPFAFTMALLRDGMATKTPAPSGRWTFPES